MLYWLSASALWNPGSCRFLKWALIPDCFLLPYAIEVWRILYLIKPTVPFCLRFLETHALSQFKYLELIICTYPGSLKRLVLSFQNDGPCFCSTTLSITSEIAEWSLWSKDLQYFYFLTSSCIWSLMSQKTSRLWSFEEPFLHVKRCWSMLWILQVSTKSFSNIISLTVLTLSLIFGFPQTVLKSVQIKNRIEVAPQNDIRVSFRYILLQEIFNTNEEITCSFKLLGE